MAESGSLFRWRSEVPDAHCLIFAAMAVIANSRTFDVASVKPSTSNGPPNSNFPLGPGEYGKNAGFFSATNHPFSTYLFFAYKPNGNQAQFVAPQLPA